MGEKKKKVARQSASNAQFNIRMTEKEKELLETAAAFEGYPLGTWMRAMAIKSARQILAANAGTPTPTETTSMPGAKKPNISVKELDAMIAKNYAKAVAKNEAKEKKYSRNEGITVPDSDEALTDD